MSRLHINENYVIKRLPSNDFYNSEVAESCLNPAHSMSNLTMYDDDYDIRENDITREMLSESYGMDEHAPDTFPHNFKK